MKKKKIVILGSTGSIGVNTLELARDFKDRIEVIGLSTYKNITALENQARYFKPAVVAVRDESQAKKIQKRVRARVISGIKGVEDLASLKDADVVIVGISGAEALRPLLSAIRVSKKIALANKEALVMAGKIIMNECAKHKAQIIPVDSEQSAIFQCLEGRDIKDVNRLYITSSGGPLLDTAQSKFRKITPEAAVRHPRWKMGKKISVDSATLMNKALEIIEARWLFGVSDKQIEVLVHRQAIVHSMVELIDGSILAQLGKTDMKLPLLYAISYPERWTSLKNRLNIADLKELNFEIPNGKKFVSLGLAYQALKADGTMPCVLNAANEVTVEAFLNRKITFDWITKIVSKVMDNHKTVKNPGIGQILKADSWARQNAKELIDKCRY